MQQLTQDLPANLKYTIYDFTDQVIGVRPNKKSYVDHGYLEQWDLHQVGVHIVRRTFPSSTNLARTVIYGTSYTIASQHVWPDWSGSSGTNFFKALDFYVTGNMYDFMHDVVFYRLSIGVASSTL